MLYLSNFIESKGYLDVVRACAAFPKETRPRLLLFGGFVEGDGELSLQRLIAELGLEDSVEIETPKAGETFLQHRERVRQAYENASVFVLPTYYPREAQPVSIVEALNAGLPVISTNHASIPEYISDGRNGLLVSPRSPIEITRALRQLLSDLPTYTKMSAEARRSYDTRFGDAVVLEDLLEVLKRATSHAGT